MKFKLHEDMWSFGCFFSLLYPLCLEECLTQNMLTIHLLNERSLQGTYLFIFISLILVHIK